MNNKRNYEKGNRIEILKALYACGTIPYKSLRLFDGTPRLVQRKAHAMERDGILRISKEKGMKRLQPAKGWDNDDNEYYGFLDVAYFENYKDMQTSLKNVANDPGRMNRAVRNGETTLFMHFAGIPSFPDEKRESKNEDELLYFSSKEIKDASNYTIKDPNRDTVNNTINTRINGFAVTPGGRYAIYDMMKSPLKYTIIEETRIQTVISQYMGKLYPGQGKGDIDQLILADNYKILAHMFVSSDRNRERGYIHVNKKPFKSVYALPTTRDGVEIMKLMSRKDWKAEMRALILPEEKSTPHPGTDCDYFDGETFYLVFCMPDLVKLRNFVKIASIYEDPEKYTVVCFDNQAGFVDQVAGEYVSIQTIGLDEYKRALEEL